MRIFIVAVALVVLGCGTTDPTGPKEKEVGYWGEQSSSGKSLKWTCTNSLTFQDTCNNQHETKHIDENLLDNIWNLLKRI